MKKTILLLALAIFSVAGFAQNLASIIEKHEKAMGAEKMKDFKTTLVEGVVSTQGMSINMTVLEKQPDKLRTEMDIMGSQMITVVNGDKGYMINPMMGSTEPVSLSSSEISSALNNRVVGSTLGKQLKDGKLEYIGESEVKGKSCYKLKNSTEAGDAYMFLDKKDYLLILVEMEVSQMGQTMSTSMHMTDYKDVNGVKVAHKILSTTMGMESVIEFTKIEFNVPIDDSKFEVK